jgi:hypothetical protein
MVQEMRSLLDEELSLIDFLLDQIILLKEIVPQQGGVVPSIVTELLHQKCVAPPLDMVANGTEESRSLVVEEPSDEEHGLVALVIGESDMVAAEDINDEDSLPTPEIRMHIAIEVICYLKMAQEMRSLSLEELSLIDFLLDQIVLLKEVVAQQGGLIPQIISEFLCHK